MTATLRLTADQIAQIRMHLFRADRDEHAAILLVGSHRHGDDTTVLAREVYLIADEEFPPGEHGYRQIAPVALARLGNRAYAEQLGLVSLHSHPGADRSVALSPDDLNGHQRVFPHLLDIVGGRPVGGLAMGTRSAAGEIWLTADDARILDRVTVIGEHAETLHSQPPVRKDDAADERHDRQVRLFGAEGQRILCAQSVAVIGVGGGGSLVVEQLAHLGIGEIVAVDFDTVAEHNLSRIVGATADDAHRNTKKIEVARRLAERIDPTVRFTAIDGDVVDAHVAQLVTHVDFIVLATDSHLSRLVVNAIANAHLIPAVQIGAKADTRPDGSIEQIYCAVRPILPPYGCLHCAGAIDQLLVQRETVTEEERIAQDYLGGDSDVIDPSVITLNATTAAAATNLFLLSTVGLGQPGLGRHRIHTPADGEWLTLQPQRADSCPWCSLASHSQFARGDAASLPVRLPTSTEPDHPLGLLQRSWRRLRPGRSKKPGARHSQPGPTGRRDMRGPIRGPK
jgi:molybdopterin/thiamine biosynthesis adenylyltransferase